MKISGLTILRNAVELNIPFVASISSILPLCDEFVVVLGDSTDDTEKHLLSIGSPKIRIIKTVWDFKKYNRGGELLSLQTNIGKQACTGDWLFYLQGDEIIHEDDLSWLRHELEYYLDKKPVDGFSFKYLHFWGDASHYIFTEDIGMDMIRIVRNEPGIQSSNDAHLFVRKKPLFTWPCGLAAVDLRIVPAGCKIYHYSYVKPEKTQEKRFLHYFQLYKGNWAIAKREKKMKQEGFAYGDLEALPVFTGKHPRVIEPYLKSLGQQ
jgi:glycosyltransferase involved in cell wall biosynthesis